MKNFKHKGLILSILVCIAVFLIYLTTVTHKISYVALGDSVAAGQNPYGQISYGYTDLVANYLRRNDLLDFYTKDFAKSGDQIADLQAKLEYNETITYEGKKVHIKQALREADLVTISIGANDFIKHFSLATLNFDAFTYEQLRKYVEEVIDQLDPLLAEIAKYAKKTVLILGYYNPLPRLTGESETLIDELFQYADQEYERISKKYHFVYLAMYEKFKGHTDYLPNPLDIHPSLDGYQVMANSVIDYLEKNVWN